MRRSAALVIATMLVGLVTPASAATWTVDSAQDWTNGTFLRMEPDGFGGISLNESSTSVPGLNTQRKNTGSLTNTEIYSPPWPGFITVTTDYFLNATDTFDQGNNDAHAEAGIRLNNSASWWRHDEVHDDMEGPSDYTPTTSSGTWNVTRRMNATDELEVFTKVWLDDDMAYNSKAQLDSGSQIQINQAAEAGDWTSQWHEWSTDMQPSQLNISSTLGTESGTYLVEVSDDAATVTDSTSGSLTGGTDNIDLTSLQTGRYLRVTLNLSRIDGNNTPTLASYTATANEPPIITSPSPSHNATGVSTSALSVNISDPDGDNMTVQFYWSDGTLIEQKDSVSSGTITTSTDLGLSSSTEYSWYVTATDPYQLNTSLAWNFTTAASSNSGGGGGGGGGSSSSSSGGSSVEPTINPGVEGILPGSTIEALLLAVALGGLYARGNPRPVDRLLGTRLKRELFTYLFLSGTVGYIYLQGWFPL